MSNDEILIHIEKLRENRQLARLKPVKEQRIEKKARRSKFVNPIQEISGELSDILGQLMEDNE